MDNYLDKLIKELYPKFILENNQGYILDKNTMTFNKRSLLARFVGSNK